ATGKAARLVTHGGARKRGSGPLSDQWPVIAAHHRVAHRHPPATRRATDLRTAGHRRWKNAPSRTAPETRSMTALQVVVVSARAMRAGRTGRCVAGQEGNPLAHVQRPAGEPPIEVSSHFPPASPTV